LRLRTFRRAERIQQGIRLQPLQPADSLQEDAKSLSGTAVQEALAETEISGPDESRLPRDAFLVDTTAVSEKSADLPADVKDLTDRLGDIALHEAEKTEENNGPIELQQGEEKLVSEDHKEVEEITNAEDCGAETLEERAKKRIHSRKFRDYCAQDLSKDLGKYGIQYFDRTGILAHDENNYRTYPVSSLFPLGSSSAIRILLPIKFNRTTGTKFNYGNVFFLLLRIWVPDQEVWDRIRNRDCKN
jgi:hypothetical protein